MSSCTVYTEKRSEALSQNVGATRDSIAAGRFDLADKYSIESVRLAFPPKKAIKINPIITKKPNTSDKVSVSIEKNNKMVSIKTGGAITANPSVSGLDAEPSLSISEDVLRIVVPERFKDASLLVENSTEWQNLLKEKKFAEQLRADNINLNKAQTNTAKELTKQSQMSSKMVQDLNNMQTKLVKKDLVIIRLWVALISLAAFFAGCVYLRVKGVL